MNQPDTLTYFNRCYKLHWFFEVRDSVGEGSQVLYQAFSDVYPLQSYYNENAASNWTLDHWLKTYYDTSFDGLINGGGFVTAAIPAGGTDLAVKDQEGFPYTEAGLNPGYNDFEINGVEYELRYIPYIVPQTLYLPSDEMTVIWNEQEFDFPIEPNLVQAFYNGVAYEYYNVYEVGEWNFTGDWEEDADGNSVYDYCAGGDCTPVQYFSQPPVYSCPDVEPNEPYVKVRLLCDVNTYSGSGEIEDDQIVPKDTELLVKVLSWGETLSLEEVLQINGLNDGSGALTCKYTRVDGIPVEILDVVSANYTNATYVDEGLNNQSAGTTIECPLYYGPYGSSMFWRSKFGAHLGPSMDPDFMVYTKLF